MRTLATALLLALVLSGCTGTTSRQTFQADGSESYRIECPGVTPCYEKAGDLCKGRGYTVINQSAEQRGPSFFSSGDNNNTALVIRCNR